LTYLENKRSLASGRPIAQSRFTRWTEPSQFDILTIVNYERKK